MIWGHEAVSPLLGCYATHHEGERERRREAAQPGRCAQGCARLRPIVQEAACPEPVKWRWSHAR